MTSQRAIELEQGFITGMIMEYQIMSTEPISDHDPISGEDWKAAKIERLEGELRELRKDKERLDWLIEHAAFVLLEDNNNRDRGDWFVAFFSKEPERVYSPSAREAIDAAMKER